MRPTARYLTAQTSEEFYPPTETMGELENRPRKQLDEQVGKLEEAGGNVVNNADR